MKGVYILPVAVTPSNALCSAQSNTVFCPKLRLAVFNITITVVICGNTKRYMVSSGGMISVPERYSFQPKIPTHNDRK